MDEKDRPELGTPNDPTAGDSAAESHPDRAETPEIGTPDSGPEAGQPKDPNA
jgi:hypothetical protein